MSKTEDLVVEARWIDCADRLPGHVPGQWSATVLVYDGVSVTTDAYYRNKDGKSGFWFHHRYPVKTEPLCWMVTPPPPARFTSGGETQT